MFTAIIALLTTVIPGLTGLATNWTKAYYDAKVRLVTARIGGDVDVATKLVQGAAAADHETTTRLSIIAGSKILVLITLGFALPWIIYEWKVVVWDNVLGYWTNGNTNAIHGQVADWANVIIASIFGSATVMGVGKMYFSRDKTGE
jgi:hypothetical protein